MSESRPEWQDLLKAEPFKQKTFTSEHMGRIASMAESGLPGRKEGAGKRIRTASWLLAAVCLCLLLVYLPYDRLLPSGSTSQRGILDEYGNVIALDSKWSIPPELFPLYQSYSDTGSEEPLRGLSPLDIFRLYMLASHHQDNEILYRLLIKGEEHGTPSLEEYLADVKADPEVWKRSIVNWVMWQQSYYLQEEINGDEALIRMSPRRNASGTIAEDEKAFRLVRNEDGIWKVGWLAMQ